MASLIGLIRRNYSLFNPKELPKSSDAIRIGLLGCSVIAPLAVIAPAKGNSDVIVAAIAARDPEKAALYAKKHGIPIVHKSYNDLVTDPSIDAIYIPLPLGLHCEWALKSLQAGKHVLLEKPSVTNASEARLLFNNPLLIPTPANPHPPILLEAFHSRFHPSYQLFLSLLDRPSISHVFSTQILPIGYFNDSDIRWNYSLSGGVFMDLGTYLCRFLRDIFGEEPEECVAAIPRLSKAKAAEGKVDEAMEAVFRFPGGKTGSILADLAARAPNWWSLAWLTDILPRTLAPVTRVVHKEVAVQDGSASEGEEHRMVRTVMIWNMILPMFWHRIDVVEDHVVVKAGTEQVARKWQVKESKKAYTAEWEEAKSGQTLLGKSTYEYMLDEFVNRIKGRKGSGVWVDAEDSIAQMEMMDMGYEKSGLGIRPSRMS